MNIRTLIVSLFFFFLSPLPPPLQSQQRDSPMTQHAGPVEVKTTPLDPVFKTDDNSLGRLSLEKQFHGDLEVTGKGEMLSAGSPVKGSGAYVAIERVSGTLHGRPGTFIPTAAAPCPTAPFNSTSKWCQIRLHEHHHQRR